MANFFDQFDAPPDINPETGRLRITVTRPDAPPSAGNVFDQFDPTPASDAMDFAKSAASGVANVPGGVAGLPNTMGQLMDKGLDFLPNPAPPEKVAQARAQAPSILPSAQTINQLIDKYILGPLGAPQTDYKPQTKAGEYAKTGGEFALGALMPGGVLRKALNVAAPAVGSEAAGQATQGTKYEPWARFGGAIAGGMVPGMTARAITPNPIPASRQQSVSTLRNEGVTDITAGQATGSRPLQWMESALGDLPFSGKGVSAKQVRAQEQFTQAALRRVGETADRATPQVVDRAFNRIGNVFDQVAQRHTMPVDGRLRADLANVARHYGSVVPNSQQANIVRDMIADLLGLNPRAAGPSYQAFRSRYDGIARGTNDPQLAQALRGIKEAADNAMERGIRASRTPGDVQRWQTARRQYRDMLAIERAAVAGGSDAAGGLISPAQLREATKATHGRRAYARGRGDFAGLARAGSEVMTPLPQSGTAPRTYMQNAPGTILGMTGLGTAAGGPVGGAAGFLAGLGSLAAPPIMGRAIMSRPGQAYLGNQLLPPMTPIPGQKTAHGLLSLPSIFSP